MATRLIRVLPLAALLTAGLAAPATAAVINGTGGPDVLAGTAKADTIRGFGGADRIRADRATRVPGGPRMPKPRVRSGSGRFPQAPGRAQVPASGRRPR